MFEIIEFEDFTDSEKNKYKNAKFRIHFNSGFHYFTKDALIELYGEIEKSLNASELLNIQKGLLFAFFMWFRTNGEKHINQSAEEMINIFLGKHKQHKLKQDSKPDCAGCYCPFPDHCIYQKEKCEAPDDYGCGYKEPCKLKQ